jgi:hypothetical protein
LEIRRPSFESEEEAEVPPTTPEVQEQVVVEEPVQEQIPKPVEEPPKATSVSTKRRYTRKEVFDFVERNDKTLSKNTVNNYKTYLNKIYALSVIKNQEDSTKNIIGNKEALLNNTDYVNSLIKEISSDRMKICGMYSAIFYVLGKQDFTQDPRGEGYTKEFRKSYYTKEYKEKLIAEGKMSAEDA